jgi:predicted RNA-binding Zn-ribbon protein involved in translation (DUF1610 family)
MSHPPITTCPECGYDSTGDDEEFVSGGRWLLERSLDEGIHSEEYSCPECSHIVHRGERRGVFR